MRTFPTEGSIFELPSLLDTVGPLTGKASILQKPVQHIPKVFFWNRCWKKTDGCQNKADDGGNVKLKFCASCNLVVVCCSAIVQVSYVTLQN